MTRPTGTEGDSSAIAHDDTRAIRKTLGTLGVMVVALAIPYASPRLRAYRVIGASAEDPPAIATDEEAPPAVAEASPAAAGEQSLPASENFATVNNALPALQTEDRGKLPEMDDRVRATLHAVPLEDPSGHALVALFERLARTDRREDGAVTRILHYGDSVIASDYVSGTLRRRLQARFGDAGHGFILIANPWQWYFHNDVMHASDGQWAASRLAGPIAADGMYGLGGVSFTGYGGGVAWFGTATHGDFGRRVSRFDLHYLEQPGGGTVEMSAHGVVERFSTRGEAKAARVHSIHVEDGEARLTVRVIGGPVRLFGVALERDRPGVVYDALGSHAAMAVNWQRQDREHWQEEMSLRDPALVVLEYGTNESDVKRFDAAAYERMLGGLVDEVRAVAPHASVLVVAPLDRGEWTAGRPATRPVILDLVAIQRRVAAAHGAAFWNTFDAMGGEGSIVRWFRTRPQLAGGDLTHPTPLGAQVLGDLLADAILAAYDARAGTTKRAAP